MSGTLVRVTWVDYTPKKDDGDSDPTVRLCGRSEDGERVVRYVEGCRPHCYVPASEGPPDDAGKDYEILDVEAGYQTHDRDDVLRVTLRHPKQIPALKRDVDWTAEADIPFYRRATWDYGLSGYVRVPDRKNIHIDDVETEIDPSDVQPIQPRVVIGDIEVLPDSDKTFDEMQEAVEDPIIAATLFDSYTEEYVLAIADHASLAEGSDVKQYVREHWAGHELAEEMVEEADITFVQANSETDLINTIIGKVQEWRPDLLSGWNWIDFDHDYLTKRAREKDGVNEHQLSDIAGVGGRTVETVIKGLPGFDQLQAFDDKISWSENRSLSLEYVANEEIGIGKVEAVDIATAWEEDRARLAAYNLLDVQLCVAITEKHGMEEFYADLADLSGIQIYDVFYEKRLVDGYIGSRRRDDQVLPNQADREIVEPAGGLVLSPSQGVVDNVAVFDLKSLYPSSMITCNISPEVMTEFEGSADVVIPGMPEKAEDVGGSIEPSDINWKRDEDLPWSQSAKWFWFGEQGLLAEYVAQLFVEREHYKSLRDQTDDEDKADVYDRRQRAIKVIMNSFYGVSNSPYYRLARNGIGDAITGVSRYVLWRGAQYLEEKGYDVVYGDTDSVFVRLSTYDEDRSTKEHVLNAKGLCNQLNEHMTEVANDLGIPDPHPFLKDADLHGTDQHCWTWEFEKFYSSYIQAGSKKRYAGALAWKEGEMKNGEPDVTGFESQRADVPKITAEVQTDVIEMVLGEADFSQVSQYLRGQIEQIRNQGELDEIGIPKSISKPLEEYPNMARVRAAKHSNRHLGKDYGPGDSPWMYYVNRTPTGVAGTDVIAIDWNEEIPEGYEINEEKTIVKAFESALSPIIGEVGWTFSELRSGKRATSAEEAIEVSGDPFARNEPEESEEESTDESDEWTGAEAW